MPIPLRRREGWPRSARVRRRSEFRVAQRKGRRRASSHFVVLLHARPGEPVRLGITTSRKVGSAPARSRVRRLVREFFRRRRAHLPRGMDVIVIARPGAAALDYARVCTELSALLDEQ